MNNTFVHIGFGNLLSERRIVAIVAPGSAPIKRYVRDAKDKELVIDFTNGRRTKAIVFTDSNYLVLVALEPGTISNRVVNSV